MDTPKSSPPTQQIQLAKLPGPGELIRSSWETLKLRWKSIVGVYILFVGIILLLSMLFGGGVALSIGLGKQVFLTIIGFLIFYIGIFLIGVWMQAALALSIVGDSNTGVVQNIKLAWPKIIPLFLVTLLMGLIVLGGFMLFVIPGIIFMIWFAFGNFIVVFENKRGVDALFTSKEYMKGNFLAVLGRGLVYLLFVFGVMFLFGIVTGVLKGISDSVFMMFFSQLVTMIANGIVSLLGLVYGYKIYEAVRNQKKDVKIVVSRGAKTGFIIVLLWGVISVVLLFYFIRTLFMALPEYWGPMIQKQNQKDIQKIFDQTFPSDFPTEENMQDYFNSEEFQKQLEKLPPEVREQLDNVTLPPESSDSL
jgi:hypothetical protein